MHVENNPGKTLDAHLGSPYTNTHTAHKSTPIHLHNTNKNIYHTIDTHTLKKIKDKKKEGEISLLAPFLEVSALL